MGATVDRKPQRRVCARDLQVTLGGAVKAQLQLVMALFGWLVGAVAVRMHDRYLAS